ncbi:hypothetical protein [Streptomyces cacaoi]|uniref:hypothetical protein n=1 Tax=Streptomyces cacaoi TaxID=1898 RepID=UPI003749073C
MTRSFSALIFSSRGEQADEVEGVEVHNLVDTGEGELVSLAGVAASVGAGVLPALVGVAAASACLLLSCAHGHRRERLAGRLGGASRGHRAEQRLEHGGVLGAVGADPEVQPEVHGAGGGDGADAVVCDGCAVPEVPPSRNSITAVDQGSQPGSTTALPNTTNKPAS